jgi:hypothetical protein
MTWFLANSIDVDDESTANFAGISVFILLLAFAIVGTFYPSQETLQILIK